MTVFGKNLKKHMALKGLTQTVLANQLGIKQGSISDWMRKDVMPEGKRMLKVAEILGVGINELLYEEGATKQDSSDETILVSKKEWEAREREIQYLRRIHQLESPEQQ
jgi:transcriptional regulator with XRE-family HTH domain